MSQATWGDVRRLADDLNLACNHGRQELLWLIAQLPLIGEKPVRQLSGLAGPASLDRRLSFLLDGGLLAGITAASATGRRPRLFYLTDLGLATLAQARSIDIYQLARRYRLDRAGLIALIPRLPVVQPGYALLGTLAAALKVHAGKLTVERPWRRRFIPLAAKTPKVIELPLRVTFARPGGSVLDCLLLPDLGMFAPIRYRQLLGRLMAWRRTTGLQLPLLVISAAGERAVPAWRDVLAELAEERGDSPLPALVSHPSGIEDRLLEQAAPRVVTQTGVPCRKRSWRPLRGARANDRVPELVGQPLFLPTDPAAALLALRPADREVIDVIGRYPLLTVADLAVLRHCSERDAERHCARLIRMGFVQRVERPPAQLASHGTPDQPDAVLQLTGEGFKAAAGRCVLPLEFVRRKILGADGTKPQQRRAARLHRHFAHTRGVVDVFIGLMRRAKDRRRRGADDALLEWRSDVLCSCRTLQPDGYGLYRRNGRRYGFFLEFDRATEHCRDYHQKFSAYYEYRDSGAYQRDYDSFPTILLITTGRQGAEELIAAAARDVAIGHPAPLPLLLTCTWRIHAKSNPDGMLGEVWRTAASHKRRYWQLGASSGPRLTVGARR